LTDIDYVMTRVVCLLFRQANAVVYWPVSAKVCYSVKWYTW